MDLRYPAEVEDFRAEVRAVIAEELPEGWAGTGAIPDAEATRRFVREWRRTMYRRGLLGVAWPVEYGGRGLTPLHQIVLVEELTKAGLPFGEQPADLTGVKMLGNTLLRFGTAEQKQAVLPALLSGDQRWCQGFSEPGAGSDLAAVSTRARLDGDEWVVDGQKTWTSGAHTATGTFVLARTDPDVPRHAGLSFLLVPLDQPGVDVRPIRHATGRTDFCEVFFDGARTPRSMIVGDPGEGWRIASMLLTYERGEEAATTPIQFRAELDRLAELVRRVGRDRDPLVRSRLGRAYVRVEVMRQLGLRIVSDVLAGGELGAASSVSKLFWSEYHREVTALALDVQGLDGLALAGKGSSRQLRTDEPGADPASSRSWWDTALNARAGTIYAGTSQIQRNILAERVLGLPREPAAPSRS
ncbi:MAG: acyl-CoA dehydrogenase family protein [Pseudonocardia sp.]|uniref:acyl-CoA dehydrogenase family protein n=1 Tax=unclassified Pseudonocardia TaxID=2619320 RepID=UPI00086AD0EC|nr:MULTISPECIES: acyl-CoA dehydrogenase family protein [unclassified Pseudonocardia]MBN9109379.1 acyl-CoA dehydrogenase family protein [Pseudonocardia sp.]ODU29972.1 MAG: acyl-CoA dehydrogenase [Pseudonocardia sp. SCN 72-51]ODV08091.1 MAG: acyl-CoA dehydrogenase [Pseudonocardia sp. SCN 73-27]